MNISSTLHYSRSFSGFIWKIKLDEVTGKLWLEVRDDSTFEVNLFWVDLKNREDGQVPSSVSLDWWDSLVHVYADVLCIRHVNDTSNPGPADLRLINVSDFTESATFSDLMIEELNGNQLVVVKEGEKRVIELTESEKVDNEKLSSPEVYPEGHEFHEIVKSYLARTEESKIAGPIMYLEDESIFIVFHANQNDQISRKLVWIKNDQQVMEQVMDEKMSGYSTESFFTYSNYLIFIENRRTVKVHLK